MKPPILSQLEFDDEDHDVAERMARRLGYRQTAYTSSSDVWGLFCLRDRPTQKAGVIVKTAELRLIFIQSIEDLNMCDIENELREKGKVVT